MIVRDLDDGMAEVYAVLPAALAHGLHDRLTQLAKSTRGAESGAERGEAEDVGADDRGRTLDQLRADILCDLLLTGHATAEGIDAIRGIVQITIPATTLIGTGDDAAYLAGRS